MPRDLIDKLTDLTCDSILILDHAEGSDIFQTFFQRCYLDLFQGLHSVLQPKEYSKLI